MKILVPIKRVVDANIKVRAKADGNDVDIAGAKMSINPFCEIAVEEAIRQKEAGHVSEIIVVSIGDSKSQEQLRAAMALGADRSILVECDSSLQPLDVARALQAIVDKEQPQIVMLGKQSIDGDNKDLRLNEPRYAALPNIMKAKKKPLETIALADLGITVSERVKILSVEAPPTRAEGVLVSDVDDLLNKLKEEAKVIS